MALIRWEPARELGTIQSDINRLVNSFFDTPTRASGAPLRRYVPAMDLIDSGEAFVLKADLPGLSESDVSIEVRDNVLTVSGERKSEHEDRKAGYYRVERSYGSFRRSLTLPEGVDPAAVTATFDKGVLEVTVPKPEQQAPRKVTITVGGASTGEPQAIESSEEASAPEASAPEASAPEALAPEAPAAA